MPTKLMDDAFDESPLQENATQLFDCETVVVSSYNEREKYRIIMPMISSGGGSQLYKAQRESDKAWFVAKIVTNIPYIEGGTHYSIYSRVINEIYSLGRGLSISKIIETYHLMPIIDAGLYRSENESIPFEILPDLSENKLVEGGNHVKKIDYNEMVNLFIPHITIALRYLHENQYVHRDIKPENIYYIEHDGKRNYCIGDYGIVTIVSRKEKKRYTKNIAGTDLYVAPEKVVTPATDCFSFGNTIGTFVRGGHAWEDDLYLPVSAFHDHIKEKGFPLDLEYDPDNLQALVNALVIYDYGDRAGIDDVEEWIKDKNSIVGKDHRIQQDIPQTSFSFRYNGKEFTDKSGLTQEFLHDWPQAVNDYFEEDLSQNRIYKFLLDTDDLSVDFAKRIIQAAQKDRAYNTDLGFAKFLYYFNRDNAGHCDVYWKGVAYKSLEDLARQIQREVPPSRELCELFQSGLLSWRMSESQDNSSIALDNVRYYEELSQKHPDLALNAFMYHVLKKEYEGKMVSPDDWFQKVIHSNDSYFKRFDVISSDIPALSQILSSGKRATVTHFIDLYPQLNNEVDKIHEVYRFFEAVCENPEVVRKHYYYYGPYSYLTWVKENIGLYIPCQPDANLTINNIKDISISETDTILDMTMALNRLQTNYSMLCDNFQNDLVLAIMGYDDFEKESFRSDKIDAFFDDTFFGQKVPVGWLNWIDYYGINAKLER